MTDKNKNYFPKDFYWGASTAGHQVDGDSHNQWSAWEHKNAKQLARSARKRLGYLPKWELIKAQATNPDNYISGKGVDHLNRYKEDFEIVKKLNLNAFRFGIEWARIEPEEGQWDFRAIEYYKKYIKELRASGIEPFANLWHWTLPVWFDEKGGFEKLDNVNYFLRFVQKVADEFAEELTYIITLNEPNVFTSFGYITGEWPPQKKSLLRGIKVYKNLVIAHKKAYQILKTKKPDFRIGLASQLANIQSKRPNNLTDMIATKLMRYFWNWWFLDRCRKEQDFIGFNYYFSDYYRRFKVDNPSTPKNDLGWYMEPGGLYPLLLRVWSHYKKPIIVTENGLADANDEFRQWWIEETILAMEKSISEGVEIKGYMHWSLLDNFEWKYGWWPKFGLVEVERENGMKRKIRPSAKWFAERIKRIRQT